MQEEKNKKSSGFTLIELLVSLAVFSIIIGVAMSVFVSDLKAQRKVLSQQQVMGEMSYTLEYMSRAMRMAKKNTIGSACTPAESNYDLISASDIKFLDDSDACLEFYLQNNQLWENKDGQALPVSSSDIKVTEFSVKLSGESQTDKLQPAVTLFVGITNSDGTKSQFQTTVSQRDLDVQY